MDSHHGALALGSEMSGSIRNVFMENCKLSKVERAVYAKSNLDRGGRVENIWVRNLTVQQALTGLLVFTTAYHGYRGNAVPPTFKSFLIENVTCQNAKAAIDAVGVEAAPLRDITVRNVQVGTAELPLRVQHAQNFVLDRVTVNGTRLAVP
jgi:polygalacturonase